MRLGFFGGSFDPPHNGHLAVAVAATDAFGLDRVLLVPTGRQPLKPGGATATYADRLRMTTLLCAGVNKLAASDLEAPRADGQPNYTAETLEQLRAALAPQDTVWGIVGADAVREMPRWHRAGELCTLAEWIVVNRPGFDLQQARQQLSPICPLDGSHLHLLPSVHQPVSATAVRSRLREGKICDELIPQAVLRYIQEHGLYVS